MSIADKKHLHGVLAKIARAQEHVESLHTHILAYLQDCGERIQLPTKINAERNTIRIQFRPLPDPSLLVSVVIGDVVHNTRSSLDHLWKRLNGTGNFPIFRTFDGEKGWSACRIKILRRLPVPARTIIDALQPCNCLELFPDPAAHPLAILSTLSNADKHETIHLTKPRSRDTQFTFRPKGIKTIAYVARPPVVFHDETHVMIYDVPAGIVKPGMDVNIKGHLFVSFKQAGPWELKPVQEVLLRCIDFVKHMVVGPLAPYTK